MILPLQALNTSAYQLGLLVAVAIGFGFGFVLERSGFGRATKLAAQFYLNDMTVFKVMFTAIVTAMLGFVLLDAIGVVSFSATREAIASFTFIGPMLAGGILLGVGFIVSGYCPGTSIVAGASGNVDGMAAVGGVVAGTWIYSELFRIPAVAAFHESGAKGALFLDQILGISPRLLAPAIALAALGAFVGAEKVEALVARRRAGAEPPIQRRPRRFAFATVAALASIALVALAFPPAEMNAAAGSAPRSIDAASLARMLIDEPWSARVIDLRSENDFAAARIPTSERIDPATVESLGLAWAEPSRALVVVTADGRGVPPAIDAYRGAVLVLRDGFDGWARYALTPPPPLDPSASPAQIAEARFRANLVAAMTGAASAAPVAAPSSTPTTRRPAKKGGGCSA
ncbi:MAG TPA: YeeE/YedE thiosulfate transporter family protein [Thermoanaerobaculia bacterium]|nr:YeeE/YedE thiosulfate transporter family protein [Thermoanaerobaculia bacterium]